MRSQTVLVAFTVMVLASLFTSQVCGKKVYCGKDLAIALSLVCSTDLFDTKPSVAGSQVQDLTRKLDTERNVHSRLGRKKRSIHDECCLNGCDLEDLLPYCDN